MNFEAPQRRVLVVDDNIEAAELLQVLLQLDGYDVHTASSGESGLEEVASFKPHVVLSDIMMPGMTGIQMAAILRKSNYSTEMLMIAISGYSGDDAMTTIYGAGFDAYFAKPVSYDEISARLHTYFEQSDFSN